MEGVKSVGNKPYTLGWALVTQKIGRWGKVDLPWEVFGCLDVCCLLACHHLPSMAMNDVDGVGIKPYTVVLGLNTQMLHW
jgi:hypothetical protein